MFNGFKNRRARSRNTRNTRNTRDTRNTGSAQDGRLRDNYSRDNYSRSGYSQGSYPRDGYSQNYSQNSTPQGRGSRFASAVDRVTKTNSFAIMMLAVLVVALVGVAIEAAISPKQSSSLSGSSSTYNWDYLKKVDGRFYYTIEGKAQSRTGIDVSEHQGYINWDAVANDGISFAFIRVGNRGLTSGNISQDSYFEYNSEAAAKAGIDVGVYFFSQATTEAEAREEADFVIERLKGRDITYPVVYDHERLADSPGRADDLSAEQMTKNAEAFCKRIQEAGYTPMIYGSLKDLLRYNLTDLARYNIWLAQYDVNTPSFNQYFSIWQYSNTGSVAGVDGNVDMNIQFLGG